MQRYTVGDGPEAYIKPAWLKEASAHPRDSVGSQQPPIPDRTEMKLLQSTAGGKIGLPCGDSHHQRGVWPSRVWRLLLGSVGGLFRLSLSRGSRGSSNSSTNVKEHATPLAGAGVETGVGVHVTGNVADSAASGGCSVSTCSASFL